jgi:hypothetical protein
VNFSPFTAKIYAKKEADDKAKELKKKANNKKKNILKRD